MMESLNVLNENFEKDSKNSKKSNVLTCFRKLSHDKVKIRVKNGVKLLKHLENDKSIDKENEEKHILIRIIRGLGSANNNARSGYYSFLVATMNRSKVTYELLEECIDKHLKTSGNNPKSENSDINLGLILAYGATLRSEVFPSFSDSEQKEIFQNILKLKTKKMYIALAAVSFLSDFIKKIDETSFQKLFWPELQSEICREWPEQNLNDLYLLFLVKAKFPNLVNKNFLKKSLGQKELLSKDSVKPLCNILLDIPIIKHLQHPGYTLISQEIAKSEICLDFIKELDSNLAKQNHNKFLAVSIILTNIILSLENHFNLPKTVTPNFFFGIKKFCKNPNKLRDAEVSKEINKFFEAIALTAKRPEIDDEPKIEIIKNLLLYPGDMFIEKITKIKIIQQISINLSADGVKKLSEFYKDIMALNIPKETFFYKENSWINVERVYASQMLARLLVHTNLRNEIDWKIEQLKFILRQGFIKDEASQNVGTDLSASFRETFYHCLNLNFTKLEDLQKTLSSIVHYLNSVVCSDNCAETLRVSLSTEALESWHKVFKQVQKWELKSKTKNEPTNLVFYTLFLHMSLHLFSEQKLAVVSISEIFQCYNKSKKRLQQSETEIKWIEVVVELFLNLLSKNSVLWRKLIGHVFPYLCKDLTPTAIHLILSVLDPKNPLSPFLNSNRDDEEDEDFSDDEEESSEDEEMEYNDVEETSNDKLRTALTNALGGDLAHSDNESIDLNEMDDEQSEQLDKVLSDVFKQFKSKRRSKKELESLIHFRVRALDLIDIYLETEPSMITCIEIMVPLLNAFEFSIRDDFQKPLRDRLVASFKKLTSIKKFSTTEDVTVEVLTDLMVSLLEKRTKTTIVAQEMSDMVTKCVVFLIKSSTMLDEKKKLKCTFSSILKDVLENFITKRNSATFGLLKTVLNLSWSGNLKLVTHIYKLVFNETVKPFKRSQALELLSIFYKNRRFISLNVNKTQKKLHDYEVNFSNDVIKFLQEVDEENLLNDKLFTNSLHLLIEIKKSPIGDEHLNWKGISAAILKHKTLRNLSRGSKSAYIQLSKFLDLPKISKSEIKNVTKKQKNQNNSISKQLKKQKKIKRLETNSEGLIDVSFFSTEMIHNGIEKKIKKSTKRKSDNGLQSNPNKIKKQKLRITL